MANCYLVQFYKGYPHPKRLIDYQVVTGETVRSVLVKAWNAVSKRKRTEMALPVGNETVVATIDVWKPITP